MALVFFNNVRAIESATGLSASRTGGQLYLELRSFAVFDTRHPQSCAWKTEQGRR
jgi:hypothetical protein